jgi:hypothetical protein
MQQFEWLHEHLAHNNLDKTIILTFSQTGSWMGLRVQELFQLAGDGSFLWEWEDAYLHIPYQKQTSTLDKHTIFMLFDLFLAGLPSLHPLHQEQPLPALPPDSIPAYFSITVGDHQATSMYLPSPPHGSSPARTGTLELKHLLDQFVHLRKQQRNDALSGEN